MHGRELCVYAITSFVEAAALHPTRMTAALATIQYILGCIIVTILCFPRLKREGHRLNIIFPSISLNHTEMKSITKTEQSLRWATNHVKKSRRAHHRSKQREHTTLIDDSWETEGATIGLREGAALARPSLFFYIAQRRWRYLRETRDVL